jgi:hypothetical protein
MKRTARLVSALVAWVISRAVMLGLWALYEQVLNGDVAYYWDRMRRMALGLMPISQTMVEYPTPVLWLLRVPLQLSDGSKDGFAFAFVAMLMVADLIFTLLLWQHGEGSLAVWFWVFFGVAMGPLLYFRLDLVPALLCAIALLAVRRSNQAGAGVALALGSGLKLWPSMLWPTMLRGERKQDAKLTAAFFIGGVSLVIVAVLNAGVDRLLSPLKWQSARGLQVESVWATPVMIARLFSDNYQTGLSQWQAFEVWGPGVDLLLTIANIATNLGYLAILLAFILWIARLYPRLFALRPRFEPGAHPASLSEIGLFVITVITVILIANKTFSPQYLMWLAAPLAVLLLITGAPDAPTSIRKTAQGAAIWLLVLAVNTHLIYPVLYGYLLGPTASAGAATAVLVIRNLLLVIFGIWLIRRFWPVLRPRAETPIASVGADSPADPS